MCAAVGLCNCSFSRVQRQYPGRFNTVWDAECNLNSSSLFASLRMAEMEKTSRHPSLLLLHLSGYSPLHLSSSGFHNVRLCFAVTSLSTTVEIAIITVEKSIIFVSGVPFYVRWKLDLNSFDCHGPFQKCAGQLKIKNFNYNEDLIFISGRCQ